VLHPEIGLKKLEKRGSRSNACRLLSLGPIEGQSVQKYTPHDRTTLRRYTPRDSSRQRRHFGKSIPEIGETHSSVLGCERRPVSASIMCRSCFSSFPVCVYKFSSHYLNNIPFYRQQFGASSERLAQYLRTLSTSSPQELIGTTYRSITGFWNVTPCRLACSSPRFEVSERRLTLAQRHRVTVQNTRVFSEITVST